MSREIGLSVLRQSVSFLAFYNFWIAVWGSTRAWGEAVRQKGPAWLSISSVHAALAGWPQLMRKHELQFFRG
jgi:hypothetical protein